MSIPHDTLQIAPGQLGVCLLATAELESGNTNWTPVTATAVFIPTQQGNHTTEAVRPLRHSPPGTTLSQIRLLLCHRPTARPVLLLGPRRVAAGGRHSARILSRGSGDPASFFKAQAKYVPRARQPARLSSLPNMQVAERAPCPSPKRKRTRTQAGLVLQART